ncbi:MAG: beta-ketoacyl-[acyl-carrier-protein] synthase family protein [Candidatus Saganbacteria bacterium]|nr:beta-ketoacyl-[acyl-carrier-protein] synthase family protein [Candidatus Saganbacteria bacterium]
MEDQIVITGIGIVSPIGTGTEAFLESLKTGKSGVDRIKRFDPSIFGSKKAGEINDFSIADHIPASNARKMDRLTRYSTAAAVMAVKDSGIDMAKTDSGRIGVIFGTAFGNSASLEKFISEINANGPQLANPFIFPSLSMNISAGTIAKELSLNGVNYTLSSEVTSGGMAIFYAVQLLKNKKADYIICGGADELSLLVFGGVHAKGELAYEDQTVSEDSRPFDQYRNGYICAEGACLLLLERLEDAKKRGANIYAKISGISTGSFGNGTSAEEVIRRSAGQALQESGLSSSDIDFICSSANSSRICDKLEIDSLRSAMGTDAKDIPVSALKSMTGETFGASYPLNICAAMLCIRDRFIFPTINYTSPDPLCRLNLTTKYAEDAIINNSLICSFSLDSHTRWGNCVSILIGKV